MKLKSQLLISHVLIFLLPLLIITIFFYIKLVDAFSDSMVEYAEVLIEQSGNNFDTLIEEAEKVAKMLSHEITLQQALRERPELSSYDAYRIRMNRLMKTFHNYSTPRLDAFYVLGEYQLFSSNDTNVDKNTEQNIWKEEAWYQQVIETDGPVWFPSHPDSFVGEKSGNRISMATTIHDSLSDDLLGVILIDISEDEFRQIANSNMADNLIVFVLDENGEQVYQTEQVLPYEYSNIDFHLLSSKNLLYTKELNNDWSIEAQIPVGRLAMERTFSLMGILAVLIVLMIAVAVTVSVSLANMVARPVVALQNAFQKVENGDFTVAVPSRMTSREMLALNQSFNRMVKKLKELMEQELFNQKRLREAQLGALTAQINPHFLYNTLDTIAWNVRLNNNQDALEALYALTRLFRISISKGHDVILLKQEFEHVQMYLTLQAMRYSDILEYSICLPESLEQHQTIKLLLQPLVENAIYHGIKEADRRGIIKVCAYEQEDTIVLKVYDNGAGMKKKTLLHLNELLEQGVSVDREVFGILNVNLRIRMAYGEGYGIRYESVENCFTSAYVTIPKHKGEELEQQEKMGGACNDKSGNCG